MKNYFLSLIVFASTLFSSNAQQIVSGEYFFDTDPSIGAGTSFSVTPGTSINQTVSISTTGLPTGFHNLFIRVKNNLGVWSHYEGHMFYILPTEPVITETLVAGEYFVDTDPGIGNATSFTLSGTAQINSVLNIPTTSLTPGFHNLFIRVKNNQGAWSHYEGSMFYILPSESPVTENIVSGEWFIDTDPGLGNGTAFTTASATQISTAVNALTPTLSGGTHHLFIRVKNNLGVWSHYEGRAFNVCANPLAQSTISGSSTFCSGETIILSGTTVPNATSYLWQGPNNFTQSGLNLNIPNSTTAQSGTYTLSAIRPGGTTCDTSQTTISVTVLPAIASTNPQTICQGSSYSINGNSYTTSGTYTDILTSSSGCDSTVTTVLAVNPSYSINNPQTICPGESYSIGSNVYTSAGTYTDQFQTVNGCDSIITTVLSIAPTYNVNNPQVICQGESYTINGNTYTAEGTYNDVLTSISGCDSVVNTIISFFTAQFNLNVSQSGLVLTSQDNQSTYQWINCANDQPIAGANAQSYTPTSNGSYAVELTQCGVTDTSDCVVINTIGLQEESDDLSISVYPNPVSDLVTIGVENSVISNLQLRDVNGKLLYDSESHASSVEIDLSQFADGMYFMNVFTPQKSTIIRIIKE